MISLEVGSIVKCVDCCKDSEIEFIGDYYGTKGYVLSCQHRNAYCKKCKQMARDVSDTHKEIHMMCDACFDDFDIYDPPELMALESQSNNWRKTSRKPPLAEIRKVYPRASYKWTEDEGIAVSLFINKVPHHKLSSLFNREPNAIKFERSVKSKESIPENSAIRFLGRTIQCNSCKHETTLTYRHFELVAEKLSTRVLSLNILDVGNSVKCKECGLKDFKFIG